ncbi:MAG TPA: DUF5117 domain-containing protein, partial [Pyrinomonadaceae bacterium]|nr:DUF5117 domain-containing protein [Pyrinomonadaceae bacterium]
MKRLVAICSLVLILCAFVFAQPRGASESRPSTISEKTAGMQKFAGYFPFYWDAKAGKIWLEIDKWNAEFLYVESLSAGVGSNDLGLDRGELGQDYIVRFERIGPKVLLIASNQGYRADSNNADERRAVKDAFAESTLWGFEVAAEEGNRALVDATNFYLRDVHGIPSTLQRSLQGQFRLDASRSAFYLPNTKNFPKNTEVETTLTFTTEGDPGPMVRSVTPNPQAVTVREHVSFVELPPPGYTPRENDPRAGYFGIQYMDFATSISEPIWKHYLSRHRLQKKDP